METVRFVGGPWDREMRTFVLPLSARVEAWGGEYVLVEWPDPPATWYQWKPKELARA